MISTVTTSTVSTITTAALAGSIALIGVLLLVALLIQKEVATASADARIKRLNIVLNLGIVPLFIAFVLIVATRVAAVIN